MSLQKLAAILLAISGILHIVAPLFGGMSSLLVVGIVYLLMAEGLRRGSRLLAYIAFVIMLIGTNLSFASLGGGLLPGMVALPIFLADLGCAICLFLVLWQTRQAA